MFVFKLVASAAALVMFVSGMIGFFRAVRGSDRSALDDFLFSAMPSRGWRDAVYAVLKAVAGGGLFLSFWLR